MLANRMISALGYEPFARRPREEISVGELVRKNVKGIPAAAPFQDVLRMIERSRYNTFPVVGDDGGLVGLIRYGNLRHALFDPHLGQLVCAEDLAMPPFYLLFPDDSAAHAWSRFRLHQDDCLPVVTRESPHELIGVVRRRDLFRLISRTRARSEE